MTLLAGLALAVEPAGMVRAVVVVTSEQVDEGILRTTRADTTELLENSGRYQVLSPELVEGRLGYPPEEMDCLTLGCWTQTGATLGADQLIVLHLRADWTGPRTDVMVVDISSVSLRKAPPMNLPRQGGAPIESLELLLLGEGELTISWPVESSVLVLNGQRYEDQAGGFSATAPAGKHLVRVEAEGYAPVFAAVLVVPRAESRLVLNQNPVVEVYTRRNWAPWAAMALVSGGLTALVATSSVPAVAWAP